MATKNKSFSLSIFYKNLKKGLKIFKKTKTTIIAIPLLILLNISCITCSTKNITNKINISKYSFAFVGVFFEKNPSCEDLDEECKKTTPELSASGIVVAKNNNVSYIATAEHVCKNPLVLKALEKNISVIFSITDFYGNKYYGKPIFTHKTHDLCLVKIFDNKKLLKVAKIANKPPEYGEKIYSLAAPLSTFDKETLPQYEGYFSGKLEIGGIESDLYSLPATYGSSGAPVFNEDGKLIGIIHSVTKNFHHLTLSVPWEILNELKDIIEG